MGDTESRGAGSVPRVVGSALIAAAGVCALLGYFHWSVRNGAFYADGNGIAILVFLVVGAIAGLVSGRFRDAGASAIGSVVGLLVAGMAIRTIDPAWPTGDTSFGGAVLIGSIIVAPLFAVGHVLGVFVGKRTIRTRRETAP